MVTHNRTRQWILLAATLCLSQSMSGQVLTNLTNLTIQSGAELTVAGNMVNGGSGEVQLEGSLVLTRNLTNNSSTALTTGSGTVVLAGSSQQAIGGSSPSRFAGLTQNNAAGTILNQDIEVDGTMTMTAGSVDLNGQTLDLGTTGEIVGESDMNRIFGATGSIVAERDLNAPTGADIAGMGVAISSGSNLGSTTITRSHAAMVVGTGNSIDRSFDILPANNTGLAASLRIEYFDSELNGQDPSTLTQWRKSSGAANWTPGFVTASGAGFVEGGPYDFMALWTLSADGTSSLNDQLPGMIAQVYPNPIAIGERLTVEGLDIGSYTMTINDVRGRKVWESQASISSTGVVQSYELPVLPEGMYALQILSATHLPFTTPLQILSR